MNEISRMREKSHSEKEEPFLEKILSQMRFKKVFDNIVYGSIVLDLGCGYKASLLKILKEKKKCQCYGIDISVDKKIQSEGIFLIEHNLEEKFPFSENSFDFVTSLANLEHLNNPEKFLFEVNRVLKPGGKIFLTTPSYYAKPFLEFLAFRIHFLSEEEIRDHKNYFNRKTLLDIFQKVGFKNIKHRYFQFFMNNFIEAEK